MTTYVVRVWVPDRPGALGAVASRIGAVRGDLVGVDILERGGGRAIDELVVDLPSVDLVPLLVAEMGQVDGVDVEDIRPAADGALDPRLDALETAAILVDQASVPDLFVALVSHARKNFEADWAVVVDPVVDAPLATAGSPPSTAWLAAFLHGSQSSVVVASGEGGPDDVAWAPLPQAEEALVLGRRGRPFRARERRQLAALARIAGSRRTELEAVGVAARNAT